MDYEKKYKEMKARVLEIGQGYVKGVDFSKPRQIAEYICPELGESEDANIRGAIIDYLKDNNLTEWAAWLEKQGEPKSTSWKPTKEQYGALNYAFNCCPDTELGNYFEGVLSNLIDELHNLENQIEQKPDKVEPKFKVGDWVACNIIDRRYLLRIISISDKEYIVEDTQGVPARPKMWYLDKYYHLWTIDDAKDGDVLAGEYDDYKKPWVGIFKCISENRPQRQFDSYCFIISSRHGFITPDSCDFYNFCKGHTIRYTKPATKEQRDLLFQKMNEAGYEWDAEKKELKELSQSEATSDHEQKPTLEEADRIESLRPGNTCKATGWSEEDEAMYQGVIETEQYMLDVVYGRKNFSVGNESIKEECAKELAWLKSLKQRYTWKPSDEQMSALDAVIDEYDAVIDEYDGYPEFDSLVSLKNDLKKLIEVKL